MIFMDKIYYKLLNKDFSLNKKITLLLIISILLITCKTIKVKDKETTGNILFRNVLKKSAQKRIKKGADVKAEILYIDILRQIERIGDFSLNISQAMQTMYN